MELGGCRTTVAAIDLGACRRNLHRLRDRLGHKDVWPVVKADAYGHGAVPVARALADQRPAGFCVATASEGVVLRQAGIAQPVLVMAGIFEAGPEAAFDMAVEYGLACGVQDAATAARLAAKSSTLGIGPVSVHLKVDSGMGRLGQLASSIVELASRVDREPALALDGLFSNLASADSTAPEDPGSALAAAQIAMFTDVCRRLDEAGLLPAHRTLANSAAVANHPAAWDPSAFTGVRPGLAIYGASLTPGTEPVELHPAMRLSTRIGAIRALEPGANVGYGTATVTRRASRIAVLPVGYHDGLPRSLSGRGLVSLRGRRVPIIGRISMDLTLVDVTDVSAAAVGDEVILFGGRDATVPTQATRESGFAATLAAALSGVGESSASETSPRPLDRGPITVEQVADWAETIPHEILCRIAPRVPRTYPASDMVADERDTGRTR